MNNMRKKVAEMTDEQFATVVGAVMVDISEKDKNLAEANQRHWAYELSTHAYVFDRQEREIALLPTITKAEFQAYFEQLFFQENRANRFDMHWNSQPHMKQAAEGTEPSAEEAKEGEGAEAGEPSEPEFVPTYETEKRHENATAFKQAMGYHIDNFKTNYANASFSM